MRMEDKKEIKIPFYFPRSYPIIWGKFHVLSNIE